MAIGLTATLATSLLAACGGDDGEENGGSGDEQITLDIGVFGVFGYEEAGLYEEYERLHPNITIEQSSTQQNENYINQLRTRLGQNSGLADIQAIEVDNIAEMAGDLNTAWVDYSEYDVDLDHFQPWKVGQATSQDGRVIGMGTDIGPMAICYRTDLFEAAGLPTDREEVSALWEGSWEEYLNVGDDFLAENPGDEAFVDSAGSVFNAVVHGTEERFYSEDGEPIYEDSPAVDEAWDVALRVAETDGMSARQDQFTPEWDRAFANGAFATIACPAWMLGYIQDRAGEEGEGNWDVATAPTGTYWGGSFLSVPQSSDNVEEAVALVEWLTAPEQQATLFAERGSFPSSAEAAEMPEVQDAEHAYFNNAPIGQIFGEAAAEVPDAPLGRYDLTIRTGFTDALVQIEQQGESPDSAYQNALDEIENAIAE